MARALKARRFCFTLNVDDYSDAVEEAFLGCNAKYLIVGREEAETGQLHYQGYVEFKSAKTFSAVKKWFKKLDPVVKMKPHIEKANGSAKQNTEYCSKEGSECIVVGVYQGPVLSLCLILVYEKGHSTQGKGRELT